MRYSLENKERGFTLVELLIAMAISGIVLGALVSTFIIQSKSYDLQEQICEMTQTARAAMDMITREVKIAGYDPTPTGFDGIPYNASQLQILADLNGDGDTADSNEDIIYTYDAANLQIDRNTGGGAQPFAENIQTFTFAYLDENGNATIINGDIEQVRITITTRTDKPDSNGTYRTYTLTSFVTPPNL